MEATMKKQYNSISVAAAPETKGNMEQLVVCTLFENHYHKGVAALTNSLFQHGYRGSVFVGYRGSLPQWASKAALNHALDWPGAKTLNLAEEFDVHFLPINTEVHLTNYKPEFMLQVLNGPGRYASGIAYFDPDIVIKCSWTFYEEWISFGVALVHECVHNDKPPTHPIRLKWQEIIHKNNRGITRQLYSYISGGFCGVSRKNKEFLHLWKEFIRVAIEDFNANPMRVHNFDKTHPFCFLDQDALNIAAMCAQVPISEIGPEGMDFIHGGCTMSHAAGSPKPWKKNFFLSALKGQPPTLADRMFWAYVDRPIANYKPLHILLKKVSIKIASFIGRFYRRA